MFRERNAGRLAVLTAALPVLFDWRDELLKTVSTKLKEVAEIA